MGKEKSNTHHTEVHFHAPVGQYIDYIENQTVCFDKDMQMHVAQVGNSDYQPQLKKLFPCITKAAYDAGKAQIVDDELRSASVSAPKLVKAIRTNEALGYLATKNLSSKELYILLDEYYDLKFGPRNFSLYRSK